MTIQQVHQLVDGSKIICDSDLGAKVQTVHEVETTTHDGIKIWLKNPDGTKSDTFVEPHHCYLY